ncbi:hypothetical protein BGV40_16715 [Methanosarcina sp. Ant1]|nr:hypothetical protein BGV40_16715 [Methanosarcina sp. Ant1]
MTRAVTVQPNEDKEIIKLCISGIPKPDALNQFPKIGRGCELLKTVSTRISLHFPQIQEMYSFFRIDQ